MPFKPVFFVSTMVSGPPKTVFPKLRGKAELGLRAMKRNLRTSLGRLGLVKWHRRHSFRVHSELVSSLEDRCVDRVVLASGDSFGGFGLCPEVVGPGTFPMDIVSFKGYWKCFASSSSCLLIIEMFTVTGDEVVIVDSDGFLSLVNDYMNTVMFEHYLMGEAFAAIECGLVWGSPSIALVDEEGSQTFAPGIYRAYVPLTLPFHRDASSAEKTSGAILRPS